MHSLQKGGCALTRSFTDIVNAFGTIHTLRKHFFINHKIFTNFLRNYFLPYVPTISNYGMKILSNCNVEKEILLF
jgi:hypothetical protein